MAWFPKKQNNLVQQLVAEINGQLGQWAYFSSVYDEEAKGYKLYLTKYARSHPEYNAIAFDGFKKYSEMISYLEGVLIGLKVRRTAK